MTKNEQIDGIFGVIDLWASNAVRKRHDGDSVYNPYNAKELAVELYNADYRKADEVRKETAEDILTELLDFVNGWFEGVENNDFGVEFNRISKDFAEKYGVDLGESDNGD